MAKEASATSADKDFSAQFLENRKKRRRRRLIALFAVVAAVGGYYYWTTTQVGVEEEAELLIVTIEYGDIENAIPATGALQPKEVVPVGAQASGRLEEILVDVGDYVVEDQVLARIDAAEQALRVRSSELSLRSQRNQVAQREDALSTAKRDYDRTLMLHEAGAATDQELERAYTTLLNAQTQLDNLQLQIEQSETSLEQERVQLNYTEITAPMSGTVISLDQKEGATLNTSQSAPTVMQIADLTTLTVETEISEADISAIETGVDVYFTTLGGGDRRWYGNLRQLDPIPQVSNNVVLYKGRFDVDNTDRDLYPGMTTQVFFVTSQAQNVLTVPIGALTFTESPGEFGGQQTRNQGGRGASNREELAAQFGRGGFGGGRGGGSRGGRGGPQGGNQGGAASGVPSLAGSIALSVPRNATVQLVQDDGSTVVREVVVGATDRVNAEVISGLEQGDRVVAGIVEERLEEDESNDNNNSWSREERYFRSQMSGGGFRPF
jgi:macrolide-specific efflux system membrane fusion protein